MAKTKAVAVKSANVVEMESLRSEMKVLRERMAFVASLVKEEKLDAKIAKFSKMESRKAETIAKLKAKLAALEAA